MVQYGLQGYVKRRAERSIKSNAELTAEFSRQDVQAFVGEISVGTPPQLMSVTFETTSALSYFPSVSCEDRYCRTRRQYNASASLTHQASCILVQFHMP